MKVPFVNYPFQYQDHKEEYDEALSKCLENGNYILREDDEKFEEEFARFVGMKYAVAVNSGTDALTFATMALSDRLERDTVYVPGYTFKATYEAVKHAGFEPVPIDINSHRQMKFDVAQTIPVHIEGSVSHCEQAILEDAAQAVGAKGVGYSGTACYSFYPAKILGGIGDGGAVATNDKEVADRVRLLGHHWQTGEDEGYGFTSRLDNIKAAYLNVKLKYLPEILERRAEIADMYKALEGYVGLPWYQNGRVWQDYVIEVDDPAALAEHLKSHGIETLGHSMPVPSYALGLDYELPNTEDLYWSMLRLPCNETLTNEQVDYVIEKVKEFHKK